uniref:Receptor expression-enhancing protein n=1 Tax=Macrostomum lignano TaxID=282301 RepID=A0A1I8J2J2_9PLAT
MFHSLKILTVNIILFLGILAFIAIYLMFGYGSQFLANFIGFLYPAYASVKAIETRAKEDDTKWLTYWVVYAGFSLLETFTDIFLWWIPLYAFIKCIFLIYLMVPIQANGSVLLYNRVIRPFVIKHQKRIDDTIDKMQDAAGQLVNEAEGELRKRGTDYAASRLSDSQY